MTTAQTVSVVPATGTSLWEPAFGEHTEQLGRHFVAREILPTREEFLRVREESRQILCRSVPPRGTAQRRTGIVVGYVQSGKTVSMTTVSAMARDNGIRLVIAVSGTTKNLFTQSHERFERDLRGSEVGHRNWVILDNPKVAANRRDLARLVDEWSTPSIPVEDQQALFIVVMKQHQHLAELAALLDLADLSNVTALILDDEADQAGLDTRPGTGNPSTTYRRIRDVRAKLPRHTYLQYTATPQAPLLISLADMLSPEFAEVISPGEGYIGGRTFFIERPELTQEIPPADLTLAGTGLAPPDSLVDAMRLFFVGVAAAMIDFRGERYRSMLIHPSRLTPPQAQFVTWAERVCDRWRQVFRRGAADPEHAALLAELRPAHADLVRTDPTLPEFDALASKFPAAANRLVVTEVNSETGHEVDWNKSPFHILVGGEKMSRGYTVKGLSVTYLSRPPGTWTADTIQQRARFFGYKRPYLGHCRVHLPSQMISAYRSYVDHEENVRAQLRDFRGRPLREWRRAFFLDQRYRATRRNVITDPIFRFPAPAGWFEQASPHYSTEAVDSNRQLVDRLAGSVRWEDHDTFPERHLISRGFSLGRLLNEILIEYAFLGAHDAVRAMAVLCRISDYLTDFPDARCALIQIDGKRPARERTARDDEQLVDLHQGRDPAGRGYPGDAAIIDSAVVTVQLHRVHVLNANQERIAENVSALAIHVPSSFPGDVLAQPKA